MKKKMILWAVALIIIIFALAELSLGRRGTVDAYAIEPSPSVSPTGGTSPSPSETPTPTPVVQGLLPTATPTPIPAPLLVNITAYYDGPNIEVGERYDRENVHVYAVYSDNSTEILDHYILSGEVVEQDGENKFIVIYNRLTAEFTVKGKSVITISASCHMGNCGLGNAPDERDIYVAAVYSDDSVDRIEKGFKIEPEAITELGVQDVVVTYKGHSAKCQVVGVERDKLVSLTVECDTEKIPVGIEIDRNDLTVMAVYADGSTERVTTYELSKSKFEEIGPHVVKVSYGEKSTEFRIEAIERIPESMWATYTGGKVLIGRNFLKQEMHVYVVYENGEEVEVDDYTYHSARVRYVGENVIELFYGSTARCTVVVEGTAIEKPTFDYTSVVEVTNGKKKATVETAIPVYLSQDAIVSKSIKKIVMKKAFKKVGVSEGDYIAFTFDFANIDDEIELPLAARITLPEKFDMAHTFLYYTPNRKTILGRTNKTVIDENVFEVTLFKTGTYMLVYSEEFDKELSSEELGEEESEYIE